MAVGKEWVLRRRAGFIKSLYEGKIMQVGRKNEEGH